MQQRLLDTRFVALLGYLADNFGRLNTLNLSLQGSHANIFTMYERIKAFKGKLSLWKQAAESGDITMFCIFNDFIIEQNLGFNSIKDVIVQHLQDLEDQFEAYFPNDSAKEIEKLLWIKNPFLVDVDNTNLSMKHKEDLLEIQTDSTINGKFNSLLIEIFWLELNNEYTDLSQNAIIILFYLFIFKTIFSTQTYRCCLQQ